MISFVGLDPDRVTVEGTGKNCWVHENMLTQTEANFCRREGSGWPCSSLPVPEGAYRKGGENIFSRACCNRI